MALPLHRHSYLQLVVWLVLFQQLIAVTRALESLDEESTGMTTNQNGFGNIPWERQLLNRTLPGWPIAVDAGGVGDSLLFVQTTAHTLYAFRQKDGVMMWYSEIDCPLVPGLAYSSADDRVVGVCAQFMMGWRWSLKRHKRRDKGKNEPVWQQPCPANSTFAYRPIMKDPGVVVAAFASGHITARNANTGHHVFTAWNYILCNDTPFTHTMSLYATEIGDWLVGCVIDVERKDGHDQKTGHPYIAAIARVSGKIAFTVRGPAKLPSKHQDVVTGTMKEEQKGTPRPPTPPLQWAAKVTNEVPLLQLFHWAAGPQQSLVWQLQSVPSTSSSTTVHTLLASLHFKIVKREDANSSSTETGVEEGDVGRHGRGGGGGGIFKVKHVVSYHLVPEGRSITGLIAGHNSQFLSVEAYGPDAKQMTVSGFNSVDITNGPKTSLVMEEYYPSPPPPTPPHTTATPTTRSPHGMMEDVASTIHIPLDPPQQYLFSFDSLVVIQRPAKAAGNTSVKAVLRGYTMDMHGGGGNASHRLFQNALSLPIINTASLEKDVVAFPAGDNVHFTNATTGLPQPPLPLVPTAPNSPSGISSDQPWKKKGGQFFFFAAGELVYGVPVHY